MCSGDMCVFIYKRGEISVCLFGLICQHSHHFSICIIVDEGLGGDTSVRGAKSNTTVMMAVSELYNQVVAIVKDST